MVQVCCMGLFRSLVPRDGGAEGGHTSGTGEAVQEGPEDVPRSKGTGDMPMNEEKMPSNPDDILEDLDRSVIRAREIFKKYGLDDNLMERRRGSSFQIR